MLSLLLLFACASEQPRVSCERACAWTFGPCSDVNGAHDTYGDDGYATCVLECESYPDMADAYAECLTDYAGTGRFDAAICGEPWARGDDGSERACEWFMPCYPDGDPDNGCNGFSATQPWNVP